MSFRSRVALGVLLVVAFAVVFILEKTMTLTPTPASQSVFLKQYDPAAILNQFRGTSAPLSMPRKMESTGNWGFVSHRLALEPQVAVSAGRRDAMLSALEQDAETRIKNDGGTIIRERAEEPWGFQVGYQIGPSRGAILVKPAKGQESAEPLKLDITVQEMWSEAVANEKKKS